MQLSLQLIPKWDILASEVFKQLKKYIKMDIQKLKRVYDAARQLNGHTLDEASVEVGKSASMINQVLSGSVTSKPTIDAVRNYCYETGLSSTIKKLGLDPDQPAQKKQIATA